MEMEDREAKRKSMGLGGFAPRRFAPPPRICRFGAQSRSFKGRGRAIPPPSGFEVRDGAQVASQRSPTLHADSGEYIRSRNMIPVMMADFMFYYHTRLAVLNCADEMNLVFAHSGSVFHEAPECPFKSTSIDAR